MGVFVLDGSIVMSFVKNTGLFHETMLKHFDQMDVNHRGLLTLAEFQPFVESLNLDMEFDFGVPVPMTQAELALKCSSVFDLFDTNHDGFIDAGEFESQLREIFEGIALGLGQTSVHLIVNDSSILKEVAALTTGCQL
ncbi:hypothetical protein SELMODRAFT_106562 [Selaginella moellendorffii]|uniref:EF-hand domain-containing protein n=2 Tax=Selaginella moellendorffii TaxID=88036 RepID=D8S1E1_SELML|nr:hypothetical protein SELMODRAFT_106562 [Selaginella moellendorffii]